MEDKPEIPYVIGPDGERMTLDDLPPADIRRWVPRRKARVVAAVEGGLISQEEASKRYAISEEEFDAWRTALRGRGMRGLRITRRDGARRTSE